MGRDGDQAELGNFTSERQPDMEAVTSRGGDYQEERAGQPPEAPFGSRRGQGSTGLCSGGGRGPGLHLRPVPLQVMPLGYKTSDIPATLP